MSRPEAPELSLVLVTDGLATIRETLGHFAAQDGRDGIELVLAAPRGSDVRRGARELEPFRWVTVVDVDDVPDPPAARAEAVRAASAPVVLFAETHAFPRPGYVETLLRAHREGPWAAVGPAIANANPETLLSWANLLLPYGRWIAGSRGVAADVPGHNAAYKRSALLQFGDDLARWLRSDSVMHLELRKRGMELFFEPEATVDHVNVSTLHWTLAEHFTAGRSFAASRAERWPGRRRLLYVVGAPAIPIVRLLRILREIRRSPEASARLPQLLPVVLLCLVVSAAGELAGYALGPRYSAFLYDMEIHRMRYLRRTERERAESTPPS
jgi:hypothetical protein